MILKSLDREGETESCIYPTQSEKYQRALTALKEFPSPVIAMQRSMPSE